MDDLDKLLADFFAEALDGLQTVEDNLLLLEQGDAQAVQAVFRALHTIKGNSSFLDLMAINKLSHELENLLDAVRKGALACTQSVIDALLAGVDRLRSLIRGHPEEVPIADLIDTVRELRERGSAPDPARPPPSSTATATAPTEAIIPREQSRVVGGFAGFLLAKRLVDPVFLLDAVLAQDFGHEAAVGVLRAYGISPEVCIGLLLTFRDAPPGLIALARDRAFIPAEVADALALQIHRQRPSIAETLVRLDQATPEQMQTWLATYMAEHTAVRHAPL